MGKDLKGKELGTGLSQRKDGKYCARYTDRFGKRVSIYNRNLQMLKDQLNEALYNDKTQKNVINPNINLDEWFEKWINVYKFNTIRANTMRIYKQVYYKHISPVLGNKKITQIKHVEIVELIKNMVIKNYSYDTQNKIRIILLDMFDKAMIDELVVKNPAKGIRLQKNKANVNVLSLEDQNDFFECAKGTFYNNLFQVAILTGLRQGELCALTWDDIDLKNKCIIISKTLLYQKLEGDSGKTFHIEKPKTRTSARKVPINKECEMALLKQKRQSDIIRSKRYYKPVEGFEDLLFTTKYGTPINVQIYSDAIRNIVDEVNLCREDSDMMDRFSSHTFRHTFATRCFESGIHPKTVQKYLGHASLSMTMDLYTHVLEEYQQEEMQKLIILNGVNDGVNLIS